MNIVLIGPPASGKGTQAKYLEKEFGFIHLSTGDMLREISSKQGKLACEIKSLIDNGHFVSDELIIEVIKNKLANIYSKNGKDVNLLFDGFPRTINQAKVLENLIKIDYIIEIAVSSDSIVKRVLDRASCKNCGKSYLLSKTFGDTCSVCGGKITKRMDDTEEIAKSRYNEYMLKTYPIIDYFKNRAGYHKVDGEKSMENVFHEITEIIKK